MEFLQPFHLIVLIVVFVPFIAIVIALVRLLNAQRRKIEQSGK
jgi:ABC-type Na+ efflux pump permease subunit